MTSELRTNQISDPVARIFAWACSIGAVSFAAGFFGPLIFSKSNLGPLLGIFITGPLGTLAGALIGALRVARDSVRYAIVYAIPLQIFVIASSIFLILRRDTRPATAGWPAASRPRCDRSRGDCSCHGIVSAGHRAVVGPCRATARGNDEPSLFREPFVGLARSTRTQAFRRLNAATSCVFRPGNSYPVNSWQKLGGLSCACGREVLSRDQRNPAIFSIWRPETPAIAPIDVAGLASRRCGNFPPLPAITHQGARRLRFLRTTGAQATALLAASMTYSFTARFGPRFSAFRPLGA